MDDVTMLSATVGAAALRIPKTHPLTTTVGEARAAFEDAHVHMLLLTANGFLLGTLVRGDLPATAGDGELALVYAVTAGRTVAPSVNAEVMRRVLVARGDRRRAVVSRDGRLLGLLCLKGSATGFCTDADVAERAIERLVTHSRGCLR